jgi:DNA-binding NtrC family response regulator
VERLGLLAESDRVDAEHLEEIVGTKPRAADALDQIARAILALPSGPQSKLETIERAVVARALDATGGNKSAAARLIGVDRKAFDRRWERHAGSVPDSGSG